MREDYLDSENYSSSKDKEFENILRPKSFLDFMGQEQTIKNIKVFVKAAKQRSEPLDHVILHGPPGLGKTTLSHIIANELSSNLKITSGPVLEKAGDLAGLLTNLEEGDVLFIDEIHRLNKVIEEYLYSAMEDFKIDLMIDSGPSARSVQIKLNPFTLIGATTRSGLLSAPLRSRFSINFRLEYYEKDVLENIVNRSAKILKIPIENQAAKEIAKRSRGTPRILNNLLRRVRDFAQVEGKGKITNEISIKSLDSLKIDRKGLDEMDNKIIEVIVKKFNGGPVGIKTIATACGEESNTIEEVYEPFLVQEGYIKRTQKGRVATESSFNHLGINPKGGFQMRHNHCDCDIAGTYYLDVPIGNSGDVYFYHPAPAVETLNRIKPFWPFTHCQVPREQDLYFWPGYQDHEVRMNETEEERWSISFMMAIPQSVREQRFPSLPAQTS